MNRYIPEGSSKISSKIGEAVVYVSAKNGAFYAIGYRGKAERPAFNYRFRSEARRAAYVAEFFADVAASVKAKEERKAAKKAALAGPNPLQVGDVLRSSWGYDQTNIDYYEVVELVGKRSVKIREIGGEAIETGFMSGISTPKPGSYIGPAVVKRVDENGSAKVRNFGVWALKMEPIKVAGKPVAYATSNWSSYA
jgi:hypothetical protein